MSLFTYSCSLYRDFVWAVWIPIPALTGEKYYSGGLWWQLRHDANRHPPRGDGYCDHSKMYFFFCTHGNRIRCVFHNNADRAEVTSVEHLFGPQLPALIQR